MKMRRNNMKKPFMEHLQELNNRILFSFTLVGIVAIFVYNQYSFFGDILLEPLINAGYDDSNIFALTIYEGFQVKLQNTFWISIIITFPLILLILGYFVKPALEIRTFLEMEPKFVKVPIEIMDTVIKVLDFFAGFFGNMTDAAEFGKIGRYYAAESMLVMDEKTGEYKADETPSYGTDTLRDFFKKVSVEGLAGQELGDQAVFK